LAGKGHEQEQRYYLVGRDGIERIYMPKKYRLKCIEYYHLAYIHPGISKTLAVIKRYFDWPGLKRDIVEYILGCIPCQQCKRAPQKLYGDIHNVTSYRKNELISIDYFGPLPKGRGGVEYIVVILDVFTKFVKLFAIKNANSETTIKKLELYMKEHGIAENILSDNGSQFTSGLWKQHWAKKGIALRYTATYHPSANPVERYMQTIAECIRLNVRNSNHGKWPWLIELVERRLNTLEHTVTKFAPITLHFGYMPDVEGPTYLYQLSEKRYFEIVKTARENIFKSLEQRKKYFERSHDSPTKLMKGDIVYVKHQGKSDKPKGESKKLGLKYDGPFEVEASTGTNTYWLRDLNTGERKQVNLCNIKY